MSESLTWKPKKWIAIVLGLFFQSLAMLYLQRVRWAVFYLILPVVITFGEMYLATYKHVGMFKYFSFNYFVMLGCAFQSYLIARSFSATTRRPWYSRWYGMISIVTVFYLGLASLRVFIVEPYSIPSMSMYPTLQKGSYIIVSKWGYGNYKLFGMQIVKAPISKTVQRGDIIVFDYPKDPSISYFKRIIGLPGDEIEYKNDRLTINGMLATYKVIEQIQQYEIFSEEVFNSKAIVALMPGKQQYDFSGRVPQGQYFVMGDNRDNSSDSRIWGMLPEQNIVGKVVYILPAP